MDEFLSLNNKKKIKYIYMKFGGFFLWKLGEGSPHIFIPPANEVAGVYSDPYVRPFVHPSVRPSLPISNPLLH